MSDKDRQIAEFVAQAVMDRILQAIQSEEVADKVLDVWGDKIDRTIGRGLRRLGFYVLIAFIGIASMKLGLLDKIANFLTKP